MKSGDKILCLNDISNSVGEIIFKKNKTYRVIFIDNEKSKIVVCINNELSGTSCEDFDLSWVVKNFKTLN